MEERKHTQNKRLLAEKINKGNGKENLTSEC